VSAKKDDLKKVFKAWEEARKGQALLGVRLLLKVEMMDHFTDPFTERDQESVVPTSHSRCDSLSGRERCLTAVRRPKHIEAKLSLLELQERKLTLIEMRLVLE
ncbi:hypothetical protein NDU88_005774, partial [Pleurodeles waltl]